MKKEPTNDQVPVVQKQEIKFDKESHRKAISEARKKHTVRVKSFLP